MIGWFGGGVQAAARIAAATSPTGMSARTGLRMVWAASRLTCVGLWVVGSLSDRAQLKMARPLSLLVAPMELKSPTANSRPPAWAMPRTPSTPPVLGAKPVVCAVGRVQALEPLGRVAVPAAVEAAVQRAVDELDGLGVAVRAVLLPDARAGVGS